MRALILLSRQETRSYLKDPIDYFIFPRGKLLAERQKMFPTQRYKATAFHTTEDLHKRRPIRVQGEQRHIYTAECTNACVPRTALEGSGSREGTKGHFKGSSSVPFETF